MPVPPSALALVLELTVVLVLVAPSALVLGLVLELMLLTALVLPSVLVLRSSVTLCCATGAAGGTCLGNECIKDSVKVSAQNNAGTVLR